MSNLDHRKVLLINASYQPLAAISVIRALKLYFLGKVTILEEADYLINSQKMSFKAPSVVKLNNYIRLHHRQEQSSGLRTQIYKRDHFKCQYCGIRFHRNDLTLDHILPKSKGGRTTPDNLSTSCYNCNQRKGDRTPEEADMKLIISKSALSASLRKLSVRYDFIQNPKWTKYLYYS